MKLIIHTIIFLFFVLLLISCGRKEFSEEGIREIVKDINTKLETTEGVQFNWGSPEAYSIFTAYFSGEEMIFINESYTYRKPAESFNRYYFKNGNLIYSIIKKMEYTTSSNSIKGKKSMSSLEFYSDPDENVLFYEKTVGREKSTLTNDEAEEIFRHVDELKEIVSKREKTK